jgi:hypothetical protein
MSCFLICSMTRRFIDWLCERATEAEARTRGLVTRATERSLWCMSILEYDKPRSQLGIRGLEECRQNASFRVGGLLAVGRN